MNVSTIQSDLKFLEINEKTRFQNISISEVLELLGRKKVYKRELIHTESYSELKSRIQKLKMAKLPFRVINIFNDCWKGKALPNCLLGYGPPRFQLEEHGRKQEKKSLKEKLIRESTALEETLKIVEQINYIHGTNSALLPMIRGSLTLIPTGRLLDSGRAPMGGEVFQGGMRERGVNQRALSVETVRDIARTIKYAFEISNSFNTTSYEDAQQVFLEGLKGMGENTMWESHFIRLMRLKQWKPEEFIYLCKEYKQEIKEIKSNLIKTALTEDEQKVRNVIGYSLEDLQEFEKNKFVSSRFNSEVGRWYDCESVEEVIELCNPLEDVIKSSLDNLFYRKSYLAVDLFVLKMFPKECYQQLIKDAKEEGGIYIKRLQELKKICLENENSEFKEEDYLIIFQKLVVDKMNKYIQSKMAPLQRRSDRVDKLFAETSSIAFNKRDQEMIEKPFGIILASTKSKASFGFTQTEATINKAQLGKDIDLIFVKRENIDQVRQWLAEEGLAESIRLFDVALLESVKNFPLYHSPDQMNINTYLFEDQYSRLSDLLDQHAFPLYRAAYPNGEKRVYHGVAHSVRATLFAQVLMEMAHKRGVVFDKDPLYLLIVMALHDVARKNDGPDIWDKQSGEVAKKILIKEFALNEEDAEFFAACIEHKDREPATSNEQRVLHDGDCIEILRCLSDPKQFKRERLKTTELVDQDELNDLIEEAQFLIRLTEENPVKKFLEKVKSPYQALVQIILLLSNEKGKIQTISSHLLGAQKPLNTRSDYLLPAHIEEAILKC